MKKYMPALLLSVLSTSPLTSSAMPQGKWHVGVAVGAGTARISETLTQSESSPGVSRHKFALKGSGPVAGLMTGYTVQQGKNLFGLNVGGYKDFYVTRNDGYKRDTLGNAPITSKNDLSRKYTLELAGKIGRMITTDTHIYGKLGVLRSEFREQFGDGIDVRHNAKGWGGVLGLGVQKSYDFLNVGLEYNYQYYERLGTKMYFYVFPEDFKNASKFRPQYHNLFLTISKSF